MVSGILVERQQVTKEESKARFEFWSFIQLKSQTRPEKRTFENKTFTVVQILLRPKL